MSSSRSTLDDLLSRHRLILFDAVCPLCSGFVHFVLKRDPAALFRFVSVQSDLGQEILTHFGQPLSNWESNVLVEGGAAYFKSTCFFRVMAHLPPPWSWLTAGRVVPRPIRDWLYDRIAQNRYSMFGKYDHCIVPAPEVASRFLG